MRAHAKSRLASVLMHIKLTLTVNRQSRMTGMTVAVSQEHWRAGGRQDIK